jgi:LuxR family maltose regulon positive regulatory protein
MKIPIIASKLTLPRLPASYVPRPRLDRQWSAWKESRLVLVNAGAGFGKTSFLAANARAQATDCVWYALDENDAEPATFCAYLLHALQSRHGAARGEVPWQATAWDHQSANDALARLVRLLQDAPAPAVIVLDDAHLIASAREVLQFLERLIRFLPATATLVIASREPVPIPTERLRSAGTALSLAAAELRFTAEETAALFAHRFPGASLDAHHARRLAELTEGWAVGIEIFLQTLRSQTPDAVTHALEQISVSNERWFDYFAEEVVSRLDRPTQDFLRRSAVLPRLETSLCNRVLGIRNSRRILEQLSRRQLFTFPVGEDGRVFRYHHLFREFLRAQLERELPPIELRRLQRRAAATLAESGALAEAVLAHTDAGDHAGALRLLEKGGENLLAAGQHTTVQRAFDRLPEQRWLRRPGVLRVLGQLRDYQGQWEEAESIYERLQRRFPRGVLRAEVLTRLANLRLRRGEYATGTSLCRRALQELGGRARRQRADVLVLLGVAACEQGRLDEGERHLKKAAELFKRLRATREQASIGYQLAANVYYPRGEFARAKAAARRALVAHRRANDMRGMIGAVTVLAFVCAAAAETREARELATEGLRLAEAIQNAHFEALCHYVLGKCALQSQDGATARDHFLQAQRFGDHSGETDLVLYTRMGLIELALAEGNRHRALKLAEETLQIARTQSDPLQEAQCRTLLGLSARADRPRHATQHWRRAEATLREIGATFELHRLWLLRLAENDVPADQRPVYLQELLRGSARLEHDFLFLILEPERAASVLTDAWRLGVEPERAQALILRLGARAVPHVAKLARDPRPELRQHATELLSRLGDSASRAALARLANPATASGRLALRAAQELESTPPVPLCIRALGPLSIAAGEVALTHAQWRSRRARRLFEYLLTQRFRWVPRDAVLEALWPESDPDRAHNNLRQTVHLLRAALEPAVAQPEHAHYIVCRDEACRLQPGEGYAYDVEDFERHLSQAEVARRAGQLAAAEKHLAAAVSLYQGDFLTESLYEEFAVSEREELRERLLHAMRQLVDIHASARRWEEAIPLCRRALAMDPYDEEVCAHLLRAHLLLGHRHEALSAYHDYERMLVRELGVLPSARMRALADEATALNSRRA